MLIDIARIKKFDDKTINETLIEMLKIIDNLLKYVSEFVKKALQVFKRLQSLLMLTCLVKFLVKLLNSFLIYLFLGQKE